jgi:hypothetical protein
MDKKIKIVLLIICLIILGFVREHFFLLVNRLILHPEEKNTEINSIFSFLLKYTPSALLKIKWIATLLFVLFFAGLSFLLTKQLFPNQNTFIILLVSYGGILFLAGFGMLSGYLISPLKIQGYYFARWLLGAAQSPLFTGIICLLLFFDSRNNKA